MSESNVSSVGPESLRDENELLRREVQRLTEQLAKVSSTITPPSQQAAPSAAADPGSSNSTRTAPPERLTFEAAHALSKEQVQRYSRHLLLPSFGLEAQGRLCSGSALIVGCGGLGSPAALYLAAAGLGTCTASCINSP